MSRQAVSKWERAESSPDTDNLIALGQLYGVTLDELIHGGQSEAAPIPEAPAEAEAMPAAEEPAPEKAQETAPAEEQSAPKAEEPKAEPLEPDDSPFVETASHAIRLDDLKFGRNYHGEE